MTDDPSLVLLTWTHDVGSGQDELYGSFVHHLGREEEGELVQQSQCGDPGLIVMPDRRREKKLVTNIPAIMSCRTSRIEDLRQN